MRNSFLLHGVSRYHELPDPLHIKHIRPGYQQNKYVTTIWLCDEYIKVFNEGVETKSPRSYL